MLCLTILTLMSLVLLYAMYNPEMKILQTLYLVPNVFVCICVQLKPWNAKSHDADSIFMYHNADLSTFEG